MENIKIVVLGDGAVGKTTIVNKYAKDYLQSANENHNDNMCIAMTAWRYKRPIRLELCDSAGQNDYERLFSFCYTSDTRVFLFCFSIIDPDSFENLKTKWHPNVQNLCPNATIILVGTKLDLRDNKDHIDKLKMNNQVPITFDQGKQLADEIGAYDYLEYSELMDQEKLKHIFDKALESILEVNSNYQLKLSLEDGLRVYQKLKTKFNPTSKK